MSARCCELLCALMLIGLAGCVTRAEDAASQRDIEWFGRTLDADAYSRIDPETFPDEAREMVRTPIEFFGRVESEEGDPIEGAEVTISVFDHLVDPFEFPYFAFTNRPPVATGGDGRFHVTGEQGAGMYVRVDVPGWAPVSGARKLYVFAAGLARAEDLPTRDDPAVFVFEVRPPDEELRPIHTGALRLRQDGVPLPVSVRTVAPYGPEDGEGDATITCSRSVADAAPDARFDWWCELTVPGGGVQPFRIGMDRAPADGYQETARLAYQADDPGWDDRANRDLIIRFADGNYGYIRVSMRMDGDFYVAFDGVWNPSGAAWLD